MAEIITRIYVFICFLIWICDISRTSGTIISTCSYNLFFYHFHFFFLGAGSSPYIQSNSSFKNSLFSILSTRSISFAPSYGNSNSASGIMPFAAFTGLTRKRCCSSFLSFSNLFLFGKFFQVSVRPTAPPGRVCRKNAR